MILHRRFALSTDGVHFQPGEFERELNGSSAPQASLEACFVSQLEPREHALEALSIANAFSYAFTDSSGGSNTDDDLMKIAKTYAQYQPRNSKLLERNPLCFQALVRREAEAWTLVAFTSVLPLNAEGSNAYQQGHVSDDALDDAHLAGSEDKPSTLLLLAIGVAPLRLEKFKEFGCQICLKHALVAHIAALLKHADSDVAIIAQADDQRSSVAKLYKSMGMSMNPGFRTADGNPIWRMIVGVEQRDGQRLFRVRP